ncbi:MAG: glycosyltransferase family 4 protein [Pirellulales bacterium]|nr:glycosyltransferase family 4 protein [Pirellulales bacterium]
MTQDRSNATSSDAMPELPQVWVLQPRVRGYRVPVWDRVAQRAAGRYSLSVLGPLAELRESGYTIGPHFREFPFHERQWLGRTWSTWPDAAEAVRRERPAVVVFCATLTILTCWTLPKLCRQLGIRTIAWTKVHSRSVQRSRWTDAIKRRFHGRFDLAVCYGRQSLEELASIGYPRERIRIAQNTLDTDRAFQDRAAIDRRAAELRQAAGIGDAPVLVSIGRMVPRKRPFDLLAAWPRLRELDARLRLVLVGDGPLLDEVRRRAHALDPARILVTGRVPPGDDEAWLAAATAVVLPGALGLAINQAMALGRPTIVADERGADSEILEHDVTGWRYPRGDIPLLVETIRGVLRGPENCARVTRAAIEVMRDRVNLKNMVASLDAAISEALAMSEPR